MAGSPNLPAPSVEPPVDGSANDECPFPIVAIGASAGGLDAYRRLLQALPADTGMAYVLIQHLHPDFPSQLAEILQRSTAMKVIEVQDEPVVEADTVYVIPPGRSMVMDRNRLQLHPRSAIRRLHRPVDAFFSSLAEFHGNCGVGVLLSGTGSDGVEGMEELKSEGGITFAQDDSAQYDGMPKAAQTAGCVDFVLSPEGIAEELVRISKHPYVMTRQQARHQQGDDAVARILRLVHEVTGVDFGNYKSTTLQRRLTRRMLLQGVDSPEQYLRKLRGNLSEVHELYRDFLINVTRFFRDPESFDALATAAFPNLFRGRHADAPVRVWTLGCATGEEAYSLAIGLHEYVEREKLSVPIQVFATDLSDRGIEWARTGLYSREIENHVSPERLKRYFDRTDGGYRIGKLIRESCVFARQNVLNDPPFSRMDLISCRNLLIYLEPVLQQRVLPLVHYALNPGGFLWLGSAETIGNFDNLFEVLDSRHRIYRARSGSGQGSLPLASMRTPTSYRGPPAVRPTEPVVPRDPARDADRLLLARYVPAAVLVNGDAEALQFRGDTGPYLLLGGGKPSLNLYKMARDGLLVPLRESIQRARQDAMPVSCGATVTDAEGSLSAVQIDVLPVQGETANDPHFLVVFRRQAGAEPRPPGQVASPAGAVGEPGGDEHLRLENVRLVQELNATRDYLHALLEQRDAANEELQSANEEAQSANEELQSINEELQTTKEEMESANEELLSVNEELTNRHEQLAKASDDLVNIVASTQMALVSVDRDLRIRRFTPAAQDLFSLISTDIGRPLGNLRLSFATEDLESVLYQAMCGVAVPDRDVRDRSGRWHSLRIRPFRKSGGEIDGAVLVLVDIDQQKRSEASLRDSQRKFSLLMEGGTGIAIIMLDPDGKITAGTAAPSACSSTPRRRCWASPLRCCIRPTATTRCTATSATPSTRGRRWRTIRCAVATAASCGPPAWSGAARRSRGGLRLQQGDHRRHRQASHRAGAPRRRAAQGRVPVHPRPRAAQPVGADPQFPVPARRSAAGAGTGRPRARGDETPGRAHGAADRRPARRGAHRQGQDRVPTRAAGALHRGGDRRAVGATADQPREPGIVHPAAADAGAAVCRPRATGAGHFQPAAQLHALHAGWWPYPAERQRRGRRMPHQRGRRWHRHRARPPGRGVRVVRAGRPRAWTQPRRPRHRLDHGAHAGRDARWLGRGTECRRGQRQCFHPRAAAPRPRPPGAARGGARSAAGARPFDPGDGRQPRRRRQPGQPAAQRRPSRGGLLRR